MSKEPGTVSTRPPRRKTTRHPLLAGRERGVWHSDLVGKVPGYPATEEGFIRRQEAARTQAHRLNADGKRGTRQGVPDGWAGQQAEVAELRRQALEKGRVIVAELIARGALDEHENNLNGQRAKLALELGAGWAVDPTVAISDRIAAARSLLQYCHPILQSGRRVRGKTAEGYFNELFEKAQKAV